MPDPDNMPKANLGDFLEVDIDGDIPQQTVMEYRLENAVVNHNSVLGLVIRPENPDKMPRLVIIVHDLEPGTTE